MIEPGQVVAGWRIMIGMADVEPLKAAADITTRWTGDLKNVVVPNLYIPRRYLKRRLKRNYKHEPATDHLAPVIIVP
jgi:hypothetical protein